ncbi:MAG: hypothetical protein LBK82_09855, partial [Planctomycetaceae bacterium]|nr:hypothetical protein [Planctomycetaceae bacterium]
MSCRINRFYVAILGVAFFAVQAYAQPLPVDKQTNQAVLPVRVVNTHAPIYLGQDEPTTERKGFGLADRLKRLFTNLTKDDEELENAPPSNPQDSVRSITSQSVPTRPPKPPTASEIKQSVENPDQPAERRAPDRRNVPEKRRETNNSANNPAVNRTPAPPVENSDRNIDANDSEESIFQRMGTMRKQIFDKQHLNENAYSERLNTRDNNYDNVREPASNSPVPRPVQAGISQRTLSQRTGLEETARTPQVSTDDELIEKPVEIVRTDRNRMSVPVRPQMESGDNAHLNEPIHRPEGERVAERKTSTRGGLSGISIEPNNSNARSAYPATQSLDQTSPNENNLLRMARPREQGKGSGLGEYQIAPRNVKPDRLGGRTISTEPETGLQETALRETVLQGHSGQGLIGNSINSTGLDREKKLLISPRLEVETEGDPRAIVGQEALYR